MSMQCPGFAPGQSQSPYRADGYRRRRTGRKELMFKLPRASPGQIARADAQNARALLDELRLSADAAEAAIERALAELRQQLDSSLESRRPGKD